MTIVQNGSVQDLRELAKKGDVENKRRYILMNLAVAEIITGNIGPIGRLSGMTMDQLVGEIKSYYEFDENELGVIAYLVQDWLA